MRRLTTGLCAMLVCALGGCIQLPPVADMSGGVAPAAGTPSVATVPFTFDDNRIFVEIGFVKPDGTVRKALAFVNMGQGGFVLSNALYRELAPSPGKPLDVVFGAMTTGVDGAAFQPESLANDMTLGLDPFAAPPSPAEAARRPGGQMAAFAAPLKVEAVIPPGFLQHFTVVFDYGARTMTLGAAGTVAPLGTPVPMRVDPRTAFAVVEMSVDGAPQAFVIDNGGSFGAIRDAGPLIRVHPDWLRAVGGVGEANYTMAPGNFEGDARIVKIARPRIGALTLDEFGVAEVGGTGLLSGLLAGLFFDKVYSAKAGEEVEGWIGGNTLKSFRLTLDYAHGMSYWQQEAPLDAHDLDQVGLVLARFKGSTTVAAIAQKNDKPTVEGVEPGDALLRIDGADTNPMTRGELLAALHGAPGTTKRLTLKRGDKTFGLDAPVTGF